MNFCTIIDKSYLPKFLALYNSIQKFGDSFFIYVCCVDQMGYDFLMKMKLRNIKLIHVSEIEDEKLLQVKKERQLNEYCWTLKAPLILHIFLTEPRIGSVIYVDGDLFFFASPHLILKDWEGESVLITRQRTTKDTEQKHGRFQAGLIGFRRDTNGLQCLHWWRDRCIEWCSKDYEKDRWADQKYLDKWPELFKGVKVVKSLGINIGPWNIKYHMPQKQGTRIFCGTDKLVVYHFSGLIVYNSNEYSLCNRRKRSIQNKGIISYIYRPYIESIRAAMSMIKQIDPQFRWDFPLRPGKDSIPNYYRYEEE